MRWRNPTFWLALAVGLASFLAFLALLPREQGRVRVVVAARPLAAYARLSPGDVRSVELPREAVHAEALRDAREAVGRYTTAAFLPGEPILRGRLADRDRAGQAVAALPRGRAVVAVPIEPDRTPVGLLQPGRRFDVLSVTEARDGGPARSQLLLRGVELVGVQDATGDWYDEAARSRERREPPAAVLLAVDGGEAERLAYTLAYGKVMLAAASLAGGLESGGGVDRQSLFLPPSVALPAVPGGAAPEAGGEGFEEPPAGLPPELLDLPPGATGVLPAPPQPVEGGGDRGSR
ncbi:MAG: Flp pilus assembly protein CpaB [Bacillota bacterium]|nr:Flp pilus assembly protein CpaB [Bacillota bacterium]